MSCASVLYVVAGRPKLRSTRALAIALLAFPPFAALAAASGTGALVSFTSIARGSASDIVRPMEIVIRSAPEWHALWARHAPQTPPPPVDFTRDLVIGIFAGQRPTAGHEVQIVGIHRGSAEVTVVFRVTEPPKNALVAQVLTYPFHLVKAPRPGLPIRFERR